MRGMREFWCNGAQGGGRAIARPNDNPMTMCLPVMRASLAARLRRETTQLCRSNGLRRQQSWAARRAPNAKLHPWMKPTHRRGRPPPVSCVLEPDNVEPKRTKLWIAPFCDKKLQKVRTDTCLVRTDTCLTLVSCLTCLVIAREFG